MDSNFRAFWLAPVTRNILGYSLFCERREKWHVVSRKFQKKKLWPLIKLHFFYPSDLVNTKTTMPLRVGEKRWIHTETQSVEVYIHHYSPSLRGIVVYYFWMISGFFNKRENWNSPGSSASWNRKENQQQLKAHMTTGSGIELRPMLVLSNMTYFSKLVSIILDSINNKLQTEDT